MEGIKVARRTNWWISSLRIGVYWWIDVCGIMRLRCYRDKPLAVSPSYLGSSRYEPFRIMSDSLRRNLEQPRTKVLCLLRFWNIAWAFSSKTTNRTAALSSVAPSPCFAQSKRPLMTTDAVATKCKLLVIIRRGSTQT